MDINELLDFNKIKLSLSNYAVSKEAKEMCQNLNIIKDYDALFQKINETNDAFYYINHNINFDFIKLDDFNIILDRIKKQFTLNINEFIIIKNLIEKSNNISNIFKSSNINNSLNKYFNKIIILKDLYNEITNIITSDNEISANASKELKELKDKIHNINNKIDTIFTRLLTAYRNYLQENYVTNKNGKSCIVIKSEYKNNIKGVIVDISSSQQSIYIEPIEITELNNQLFNLNSQLEIEIQKILAELTIKTVPYINDLIQNFYTLTNLDFIFAKANYAYINKHTYPIINNNKIINLINAKHPLLDKQKIVPLNITIGKEYNSLIITGPNTGGKTVCLKTIGLIELMGLSGMFIPTNENSQISYFDNIFADIGDEQSIEQSLSTFSSHMNNIIKIINSSTENSLCLFDEICTGTDPIEGAKLAIAILEYLKNNKTTVVATTHYPDLKLYALNNKDIINGSFEFDIDTLKPTYRLLIGIPGKSNAFLISEKLGLNKNIIEHAKSLIDSKDIKFEDIISELESKRIKIENDKIEIDKYKNEVISLKEKLIRQQKGLDDRVNSTLKKAKEEAREILLNAKQTAEQSIKIINSSTDSQLILNEKTQLNQNIKQINSALVEKVKGPSQPISPKKIKVGASVKILSLNSEGTVETLPDKDYNLFVRVGIMRINTNLKDLEIIDKLNITVDNAVIKKRNNSYGSKIKIEKTMNISQSINLIGQTSDEAISNLDKYIDDCCLSHLSKAKIIHGRGAGILKKSIHNYLKNNPTVKNYYFADYNDGGDGATIIEFD